jgi:hypothetical protein
MGLMVITDLFRYSNYAECALWVVVGVVCLLPGLRVPWSRGQRVMACVTFMAFGVSDVVETFTGAWWRPWWLLVWKGACIAIILALAAAAWRRRKQA